MSGLEHVSSIWYLVTSEFMVSFLPLLIENAVWGVGHEMMTSILDL